MKEKLVILGAGYGGLMTAIKLEEQLKHLKNTEIILVDRNDYHQFLHLAHEIATGVKKVSDLTIPMDELLTNKKITFLQATVTGIDLNSKIIHTEKEDIGYQKLVVALGSQPNYYNIKGAKQNSFSISSVEAAAKIQDKMQAIFTRNENPKIVVGGGGFTGVELVGEILDEFKCCVTIVDYSDHLLSSWNIPEFSQKVTKVITEMGANLVLGKRITEVKPDAVVLDDGQQLECSLFIWTGGIQGSKVINRSSFKTGYGNRVVINEFCEAEGFPNVSVVGDCALVIDPSNGEVLPQCIEIALQQAEVVAKNLYADIKRSSRTVFVPKFSGLVLSVGEKYGIGKISGVKVEGRIAQMIKRIIHLRYVYEIVGLKEVIAKAR